MIFSRLLVKWFVRDSLPFSTVEKKGFRDFLLATKVITSIDQLPSESYLRLTALNDCYAFVQEKVIDITSNIDFSALQADIWTDNFARNGYMGVVLNYIDSNWIKKKLILRVEPIPSPRTAESIKNRILKILETFNLNKDKILGVTDNGSNIIAAFSAIKLNRMSCLGHNTHLLLQADGCESVKSVGKVLKALKKLHTSIIYRRSELIELKLNEQQSQLIDKIVSLGNIVVKKIKCKRNLSDIVFQKRKVS